MNKLSTILSPEISVIMPVYNVEDFVQDAVSSILNQSYTNFELIIIDDASTDKTFETLSFFQDPRIRIIRNELNLGNYPSRNRGLQMARGKYIAVMDGDDIAFPERLNVQYNYLETHPEVIILGSIHQILHSNYQPPSIQKDHEKVLLSLLENNCVLHPSLMIRKEFLEELGGYDEAFIYSADYNLMCQAAFRGKIVILPDVLMIYRLHESQISQARFQEQSFYADQIRKNYQQAFINYYKEDTQAPISGNELGHSDWGKLIALWVYAKHSQILELRQKADDLLKELFDKFTFRKPIGLEKGLTGIGCAIVYILRNRLTDGDEKEVLQSLDLHLILYLQSNKNLLLDEYYSILYYLRKRLEGTNRNNKSNLFLQQIGVGLIDSLYESFENGFSLTPRIMEELSHPDILFLFPYKIKALLANEIRITEFPDSFSVSCKTGCPKISFLIPLRIDSEERKRNSDIVLKQLSDMQDVEIIILEADSYSRYDSSRANYKIKYLYFEDNDPVFHRTKYINILIQHAKSQVVGIWDTDILIPVSQIEDSIYQIYSQKAILSYPYDGCFYTLSSRQSGEVVQQKNILEFLLQNRDEYVSPGGCKSVGGAFLINKNAYLDAGMENEKFYGWGMEDLERYKRIEILGYSVHRASGPLFHLYHPRLQNSCYSDASMEIRNRKEFQRVCAMERKELREYISQW